MTLTARACRRINSGRYFPKSPRSCLLILGLLLALTVSAQQSSISTFPTEIEGRTVENGEGIPDVHILNLSARTATITNADGVFRLEVSLGDTLMISAVRYMRLMWIISPEALEAGEIEIPLQPFVNELDEVVVSPYALTGDLAEDLTRVPENKAPTSYSLNLPNATARKYTQTENRLNEATTGAGLVPLNPLLNAITGRTKRLKKQLAVENRFAKLMEIRQPFADSVFVDQLGIPEERLSDYLYYCEVDSLFNDVAYSGDQLRIWAFFRRKGEEYRKNNDLD